MYSLLLAVIYLAFISLGLPDSMLGAAWPTLYRELDVPVSSAGIITLIICCGTVVSSLLSDRLTGRFGAGRVTCLSVLLTALALLGFSLSGKFWMLCVLAVPYGLGAGAVDAALNNFVALHYASRHMNWLHCFWGVGVSASPYIMSRALLSGAGWQAGYREVAFIQMGLTAVLFAALPLWTRIKSPRGTGAAACGNVLGVRGALRLPGALAALTGFFCYCGLETSAGLWASSYLVLVRGVDAAVAARWGALFFLGITGGRFLAGFAADRVGDRNMIRIGLALSGAGITLLLLPVGARLVPLAGLVLTGLGCAPVYPAIIHSTPENFGAANSQSVIGIEMAGAYVGSMLLPPVCGAIAQNFSMALLPWCMLAVWLLMLLMLEKLARTAARRMRLGA